MKKIYKVIILILFISSFTSCDDFLDVNDDPNRSVDVDPNLLFTDATTSFSASYRTTSISFVGSQIVQYWTSGNRFGGLFYTNQEYNVDESFSNNLWLIYDVIKNLQLAIDIAEEKERPNAAAQSKIMKAFMFLTLTNIFGDIPFSEAISLEVNFPKFDEQKDIYPGLIEILDDALIQIDLSDDFSPIKSNDLIFDGDMSKWEKFANSLKFRIYMIMVDKEPSVATDIKALFDSNAPMISSNADMAAYPFFDQANNENFMFKWATLFTSGITGDGTRNDFFFANNTLMDILLAEDNQGYSFDPRVRVYFDEGAGETLGSGAYDGQDNDTKSWFGASSIVGRKWLNAATPDYYFTYSEQLLLEAEAINRGFITGNMDEKYKAGVRANMTQFTDESGAPYITTAEVDTYVNSLPNLAAVPVSEALNHIQVQQYVMYYGRGMEAWTNWRRTEVPAIEKTATSTFPDIMRRFNYDDSEQSTNSKNFPPKLPQVTDKMWFDL